MRINNEIVSDCMTYNEKKSLYESIMKDVAKIVKQKLNESTDFDFFGPNNFKSPNASKEYKGPSNEEVVKSITYFAKQTIDNIKDDKDKLAVIAPIYQSIFDLLKYKKIDELGKTMRELLKAVADIHKK